MGTASGHIIKVDISNVILMSYTIIYRGNPIGQGMCSLGNILIQDENKRSIEAETLFFIGESADSEILAVIIIIIKKQLLFVYLFIIDIFYYIFLKKKNRLIRKMTKIALFYKLF